MAVDLRVLFIVVSFVAVFCLYSSLHLIPCIVVLPLSVKYSGILYEYLFFGPLTGFFVALVEIIYGIKVVVSGDVNRRMSSTRPTLIIANHGCRIDWFFSWSMVIRLGSLGKGRVVTKKFFHDIPVMGWAFDMAMSIAVEQNWDKDKVMIRDVIGYYRRNSCPVCLTLYPEGSALNESNRNKHQEFSRSKGLEVYEYVMHPRTKGLVECMKHLKEGSEFDIYNVTTGYIGKLNQRTVEGLEDIPSQIHYNVKRVPYAEFASLTDEELEDWLKKLWKEKEAFLKEFYQNKSFSSGPVFKDHWTISLKLFGYLAFALLSYSLFLYYLPWTLVAVLLCGTVSFYVHRSKGGWSRLILDWF